MVDYQRMYALLCTAASQALDMLPATEENSAGREVLQQALYEAEEMYVSAEEGHESPI